MLLPERLVIATGNPGKLEDWRQLLEPRGVEIVAADLPDVDETEPTYAGNARLKVRSAVAHTGLPALGDDTGVEVEALDGAPGLFTKRWAMEQGGWAAARTVLVERARGSRAVYFCAVALAWPDGRLVEALGTVRCVVAEAQGDGAGLEPCLVPVGEERPLSELAGEPVHHRQVALRRLLEGSTDGTERS